MPLGSVVANPHQPRKQMNEASIAELAASLKPPASFSRSWSAKSARPISSSLANAAVRRQAGGPFYHPRHPPRGR